MISIIIYEEWRFCHSLISNNRNAKKYITRYIIYILLLLLKLYLNSINKIMIVFFMLLGFFILYNLCRIIRIWIFKCFRNLSSHSGANNPPVFDLVHYHNLRHFSFYIYLLQHFPVLNVFPTSMQYYIYFLNVILRINFYEYKILYRNHYIDYSNI